MVNHAAGISVMTFVVAVAVSMGYYQFVYIPQANAKPTLPEEVLNPPEVTEVSIAEGSSLESNGQFFVPKDLRGTIGTSNKVVWTDSDVTVLTVTTYDGYVDLISGVFISIEPLYAILLSVVTFEFTFTEVGLYPYHCELLPWMQ